YASNLDDGNVRAKLLFTPLDIERLNVNMVRGAVRMGAYIPSQLGVNRPHPLLSGTRTPIEGLYLCGSSTGNGGGINGAPATSRRTRLPTIFSSSVPGHAWPPRNGGIDTHVASIAAWAMQLRMTGAGAASMNPLRPKRLLRPRRGG